jgi:hypothetical protein
MIDDFHEIVPSLLTWVFVFLLIGLTADLSRPSAAGGFERRTTPCGF